MPIIETQTYRTARIQIAEQNSTGWTVLLYLPGLEEPVVFQSEIVADLNDFLIQARARADKSLTAT